MGLEIVDLIIIVLISYLFSPHDALSPTEYGILGYIDDIIICIIVFVLAMYTLGFIALIACITDDPCYRQLQQQQRQQSRNN